MAKYASWSEFEKNVPQAYKEGATPEAFRGGMAVIAPPGMKVRETRVTAYGNGVQAKADVVVQRYKRAMFE